MMNAPYSKHSIIRPGRLHSYVLKRPVRLIESLEYVQLNRQNMPEETYFYYPMIKTR